jgi:acetyl esterase/lipase
MMVDSRVRRLLDVIAASQPAAMHRMSVADRRASVIDLMKLSGPLQPVASLEERVLPGPGGALAVRVYTPWNCLEDTLAGLVYFHGGGFVAGSAGTHDPIGRALANAGHCRVISVDYRLAPEHPFPAAVQDAEAAVRHVATHPVEFAIDASRLGVCGDSAGATLATVACQAIARAAGPAIALQLLLCPITDYGADARDLDPTDSRRAFAHGYLFDEATLEHDLSHYLPPGMSARDPRVSPLRAAEWHGLPPTVIHTAEYDPLRDEGRAYADRLAQAGTPVSYTCHPGMIHLFYGMAGAIPYARTAFEQIGREIRHALA